MKFVVSSLAPCFWDILYVIKLHTRVRIQVIEFRESHVMTNMSLIIFLKGLNLYINISILRVSVSRRTLSTSTLRSHTFTCASSSACKTLWLYAIGQHTFYLDTSTNQHRAQSTKVIFLVSFFIKICLNGGQIGVHLLGKMLQSVCIINCQYPVAVLKRCNMIGEIQKIHSRHILPKGSRALTLLDKNIFQTYWLIMLKYEHDFLTDKCILLVCIEYAQTHDGWPSEYNIITHTFRKIRILYPVFTPFHSPILWYIQILYKLCISDWVSPFDDRPALLPIFTKLCIFMWDILCLHWDYACILYRILWINIIIL
jgi:hypothetical protein